MHYFREGLPNDDEFLKFKKSLKDKTIIFINIDLDNQNQVKEFFKLIQNYNINITFFNLPNLLPSYVKNQNVKHIFDQLGEECSFHFSEGGSSKSFYCYDKKAASKILEALENDGKKIFEKNPDFTNCFYLYQKQFINFKNRTDREIYLLNMEVGDRSLEFVFGKKPELIPDFLEETKRLDKYSATKKVLGK